MTNKPLVSIVSLNSIDVLVISFEISETNSSKTHVQINELIEQMSRLSSEVISLVKNNSTDQYVLTLRSHLTESEIVESLRRKFIPLKSVTVAKASSFLLSELSHSQSLVEPVAVENIENGLITYQDILQAFKQKHFLAFTQPIFDLKRETPVGVEMLCRWQHEDYGLLQPYQFLPAISHFQATLDLDFYMFESACELLSRWKLKDKSKAFTVSVNINANSLSSPYFCSHIEFIIKQYDINRQLLRIEVTETGIIHQGSEAHKSINRLQDLGFAISLDDFGAGTTILGYLTYLSPNEIKIDRCVINAVFYSDDQEKKSIATKMFLSMVDWVASMENVQLVVEGIENQEQADFLIENNVVIGQGFLFGRPSLIDSFEKEYME